MLSELYLLASLRDPPTVTIRSSYRLKNAVVNFLTREDGPTAVEYAVMLALIIVVCIAAISALGSNASNTFDYVGDVVNTTSS